MSTEGVPSRSRRQWFRHRPVPGLRAIPQAAARGGTDPPGALWPTAGYMDRQTTSAAAFTHAPSELAKARPRGARRQG